MVEKTIRLYVGLNSMFRFANSLIAATYAVYLLSHGLNLLEINLVNMIYFAGLIIFEIPTGVVADLFGRKLSFVLSCLIYGTAFFVYALSDTFSGFAMGEMLAAIGSTFRTGAFKAWLVDKLDYHGYRGSYQSIFAREQKISTGFTIIGAIVGAWVASRGQIIPWVAGGVIMMITAILAFFLMKEEYRIVTKGSFRKKVIASSEMLRFSAKYGREDKVFRFVFLYGLILVFAIQGPNMQWQPMFETLISKEYLGFLFAGFSLSIMFGASISGWIVKRAGDERSALVISLGGVGLMLVMTLVSRIFIVALPAYFLHEVVRGAIQPIKDAYLNHNLPAAERATLLSLSSQSENIGGVVGLLLSGYIALHSSISFSWALSGVVLIVSAWMLSRNKQVIL